MCLCVFEAFLRSLRRDYRRKSQEQTGLEKVMLNMHLEIVV